MAYFTFEQLLLLDHVKHAVNMFAKQHTYVKIRLRTYIFITSTVFLVKYKQIIISRRRVAEEKVGIINGYRSKQMLSIVLPATNKYCDTEKCRRGNARQNVIEPNGQ